MTETLTKRQAQISYVAELFQVAFYASRGVANWTATTDENYRATAVAAGARIARTDETGNDSDSVREIASAALIAQDFKAEAVALFLDDLQHDALALAREQREAEEAL